MDFEITYVEQFEGGEYMDWTSLKVKKINKTMRGLFGNHTTLIPFDNTFEADIIVFKKQGGEFRKLPYRIPRTKYCDVFVADIYFYQDLVASSDFPEVFPCPLPVVS